MGLLAILQIILKLGIEMIRCGNQLRLNKKDAERLSRLTGSNPIAVHTVESLNNFIDRHLNSCDEHTPESRLLDLLLQDEKITP